MVSLTNILNIHTHMGSLFETCIYYLKQIHHTKYMIMLTILNDMVLTILMSDLLVRISNGSFNLVPFYLFGLVIGPILDGFLISPLTTHIVNHVRMNFIADSMHKYDSLSFDSKALKNYASFEQALNPAEQSIRMMIDWGLPNIISLFSSICGLIWTFYQKSLLELLMVLVVILSVCYYFVIRKLQNNFTSIHKKLRKIRHKIYAKMQLDGLSFQYKEYKPDHMIKSTNIVCQNDITIEQTWTRISSLTNVMIELMCACFIYISCHNISDFMLLSFVLKQLNNSISHANNFFTSYNRMKNDFDNYIDYWKNTELLNEPTKLDISSQDHIEIKNINIKRSDYLITMAPDFCFRKISMDNIYQPFIIKSGMKILIYGPSGHGKSSFVKALFGLASNSIVELSYGEGKNFYHQVSDYFQEIKGVMPISKVTIQDIFKGETDMDVIKKYLLKAWSQEEHERICKQLTNQNDKNKSNDSNDKVIIDIEKPKEPYKKKIGNRLSGGQTSRMILWQRGYDADINNKKIIILDEPCPDVDFDTYIKTINDFFQTYNDKLIIMIGHLCDCKRRSMNADKLFDMELCVEDGLIHRRK